VPPGTIGSLIGAYLCYWIGRRAGADGVKAFSACHGRSLALRESDIDRANAWFGRHGASTGFACRMIPGLRSTIAIPARGAAQNLWTFTLRTGPERRYGVQCSCTVATRSGRVLKPSATISTRTRGSSSLRCSSGISGGFCQRKTAARTGAR
tara:strand:- start:212 stop:667 length:456 start_codon:yes stop_codon:yes gene_type:complete